MHSAAAQGEDIPAGWLTDAEGHALIVIDVAAMMPIEQFRARVDELIERMSGAPKAAGVERIYVPGEMEWACERQATRHGLPLTALTVDSLKGLSADVRVDGPF